MCKVSVIIPAYNSAPYIEKTILSIQNQSLTDWELIVVDDGSLDDTVDICNKISESDDRIRIIEMEKNGGPSKARNRGIDLAKGEYLSFVDSDDTVEPDFLNILVNAAGNNDCDIVWCNYNEIKSNSKEIRRHGLSCNQVLDAKYAMSLFFAPQIGLPSLCNKIYRKEFINQNKLRINEKRFHGEDWEFNLNVFNMKPRIILVDDVLYNYNRINSGSVVSSYHETDLDYFIKSNQIGAEIAKEWGIDYDVKHTNGKLVYNSISLLRKLVHSDTEDKHGKWERILQNEYLRNVILSNNYYKSLLPIRYKVYLFLIRNRLSYLAVWLMDHE